jgi:hypothetical protein
MKNIKHGVWRQPRFKIENQVNIQTGSKACLQVNDQIEELVWNLVFSQVLHPVRDQARSPI